MLGKIEGSIAGLIFLAATTVNAGFYAGAGLGPDTADITQRAVVLQNNPGHPDGFDVINKVHLSATGIFGTLFAGYGGIVQDKIYLAAEVNGNISSTAHTGFNYEFVHSNFSNTAIRIRNSIGISIIPGYQFNPNTLFYGRLGLTNSQIKVKTTDISLVNGSWRRNGFRYGVGVQQEITKRLALRMDYSRIHYNTNESSTFDPVGNVAKTTKNSPNQQLVEFGLVVHFA